MAYGRRFGSSGSFMNSGGTVYKRGAATFEVKRHSIDRTIIVDAGKSKIIPLLTYVNAETDQLSTTVSGSSKIVSQGSKTYATPAVLDGSRVNGIKLDITIEPETQNSSNIIDFYTGRLTTSYHDVPGGQIYGLEEGTDGKVKYSDEASTPTTTDVIGTGGTLNAPPELDLTNESFSHGDVIKHWWGRKFKNVMAGGQPIVYNRWEKVPSKVKRSNPGMFYGLWVMNDATQVSGSDTDNLRIKIHEEFNEVPLIQ